MRFDRLWSALVDDLRVCDSVYVSYKFFLSVCISLSVSFSLFVWERSQLGLSHSDSNLLSLFLSLINHDQRQNGNRQRSCRSLSSWWGTFTCKRSQESCLSLFSPPSFLLSFSHHPSPVSASKDSVSRWCCKRNHRQWQTRWRTSISLWLHLSTNLSFPSHFILWFTPSLIQSWLPLSSFQWLDFLSRGAISKISHLAHIVADYPIPYKLTALCSKFEWGDLYSQGITHIEHCFTGNLNVTTCQACKTAKGKSDRAHKLDKKSRLTSVSTSSSVEQEDGMKERGCFLSFWSKSFGRSQPDQVSICFCFRVRYTVEKGEKREGKWEISYEMCFSLLSGRKVRSCRRFCTFNTPMTNKGRRKEEKGDDRHKNEKQREVGNERKVYDRKKM